MAKGEASVFSEGFNEPFLVMVSHYQSSVKKVNPKMNSVQDKDVSRFMAKKLITLDHIFGRHSGCKQCQYKCAYRDTANHLLSKPEAMRYFNKFIFAIIENPDSLAALFPSFRDVVLKDIRDSLQKEEEINDIMFCFLINAGESHIRNKGRQYDLSSDKTAVLLYAYNDLINSYFAIPVKTQLSADTERYLKEFQKYYQETLFVDKGPFPGCDEFCHKKCLFRYDVEPAVKDKSINEKHKKAITSGENAKINVKKLCLNVARSLTIANSDMFIENIALCFFIQKSVQDSVKEILLNVKNWFIDVKGVSEL